MDLVAIAGHVPPSHARSFDDHSVDRAVAHMRARGIDERGHTGERTAAGHRDGSVALPALPMTNETERLIDRLSAVQRLGGAGARIHEMIRGLACHRQLAAGRGHRARNGWDRARVRLDVALVSHRREPADLVDDRVWIAGAEQHQRADKQRAFTHAAPLQLPLRATTLRPARLYPTQPVQTHRNDRWCSVGRTEWCRAAAPQTRR